jgi:hypothetical protein
VSEVCRQEISEAEIAIAAHRRWRDEEMKKARDLAQVCLPPGAHVRRARDWSRSAVFTTWHLRRLLAVQS